MNGLNNRPFRHPVSKPRILPDFQAAMRIQQAVHQSAKELEHFLTTFVEEYNKCCGPFEWTKGPEKLRRIIELTEQWQSK